jgi:hypothetical protein
MVSAVASAGVGKVSIAIQNNVAADPVPVPVSKVTVLPNLLERLAEMNAMGAPDRAAGPIAVLSTDGGNAHSADAWAAVTVEQLIQIEPSHRGNFAHQFKAQVRSVLADCFAGLMAAERAHLRQDETRLEAGVDLAGMARPIAAEIARLGRDTEWAAHYDNPYAIEAMVGVLIKDIATMLLIERELFARAQAEQHASRIAQRFLAELGIAVEVAATPDGALPGAVDDRSSDEFDAEF